MDSEKPGLENSASDRGKHPVSTGKHAFSNQRVRVVRSDYCARSVLRLTSPTQAAGYTREEMKAGLACLVLKRKPFHIAADHGQIVDRKLKGIPNETEASRCHSIVLTV